MGWGLYNTLDASNAIEVLERAIRPTELPKSLTLTKDANTPAKRGWRPAILDALLRDLDKTYQVINEILTLKRRELLSKNDGEIRDN